jgi:hypothetical protein
MLLEAASPESVLDGPGVLALISGGKGRPETLAWAEAVPNLPVRLAELTSPAPDTDPALVRLLDQESELRVRVAHVPSPSKREEVASAMVARIRQGWYPRTTGS